MPSPALQGSAVFVDQVTDIAAAEDLVRITATCGKRTVTSVLTLTEAKRAYVMLALALHGPHDGGDPPDLPGRRAA